MQSDADAFLRGLSGQVQSWEIQRLKPFNSGFVCPFPPWVCYSRNAKIVIVAASVAFAETLWQKVHQKAER
jgi:hypothetical protein